MKYVWPAGSTSKSVLVFVQDSASTTGAGKTGLTAGAVNVQQIRVQTNNTVTIATVSVTNLALLTDAYLSGGILQVDAVNTPGWYRFDVPNEALSTGAVTAGISIIGSVSASNVAQLTLEIQLQNVPVDVGQWAGSSVTTANIALWQTVSAANVTRWNGITTSSSDIALRNEISLSVVNVTAWSGISTSTNDIAIKDTLAAGTDVTGTFAVNTVQWSGASTTTGNIALWQSVSAANVTAWTGTSVTTANIALWQTISQVNVTQWAATSTSASNIALTDFSTRLNVNVQQWSGKSISTSDLAAFSVSQTVVSAAAGGLNVTQWNGVTVSSSNLAIQNSAFKRTLTETYAADGVAFTAEQALYQIWSRLSEFSISGQIISAFRLDGTTLAMTFSLDSNVSPSKVERVS